MSTVQEGAKVIPASRPRQRRRASVPVRLGRTPSALAPDSWNWRLDEEGDYMKKWDELKEMRYPGQPRPKPAKQKWHKSPVITLPAKEMSSGGAALFSTNEEGSRSPDHAARSPESAKREALEREWWEQQQQQTQQQQRMINPSPVSLSRALSGHSPLPDIGPLTEASKKSGALTLNQVGYTRNDWLDTRFDSQGRPIGATPPVAKEEAESCSQLLDRLLTPSTPQHAHLDSSPRPTAQEQRAASRPGTAKATQGRLRVSDRFWTTTPAGFDKEGVLQRNDQELGWLVCFSDGELGRMKADELEPLVAAYELAMTERKDKQEAEKAERLEAIRLQQEERGQEIAQKELKQRMDRLKAGARIVAAKNRRSSLGSYPASRPRKKENGVVDFARLPASRSADLKSLVAAAPEPVAMAPVVAAPKLGQQKALPGMSIAETSIRLVAAAAEATAEAAREAAAPPAPAAPRRRQSVGVIPDENSPAARRAAERRYWEEATAVREADALHKATKRATRLRGQDQQEVVAATRLMERRSSVPNGVSCSWDEIITEARGKRDGSYQDLSSLTQPWKNLIKDNGTRKDL